MKVIAITGTPGTGKSLLAKELSLLLRYPIIDVASLVKGISEGYDRQRQCYIVDTHKLNKALIQRINRLKTQNKGVIIDSHLSHFLPEKHVDLCVVAKCDIKALKKRLTLRGYPRSKIRENLDAEIFDVCLLEAEQLGHNVLVVDTTSNTAKKLAREIAKLFLSQNP